MLEVCGAACGNFNLCVVLRAGIEGATHAAQDLWRDSTALAAEPSLEQPPDPPDSTPGEAALEDMEPTGTTIVEPEGTLLVDTMNGFNELNHKAIFWTVAHLWPQGVRFSCNCS